MLTQLIYSSRSSGILNRKNLIPIVSLARRKNSLHGLTGALCYANGTFLQYLEGEQLVVDSLYQHLLKDERHNQMEIVRFDEIAVRRFPTWSMGFFSYESEIGQLFSKHARRAELSLLPMTTSEVNEFFDEVTKSLAQ